MTNQVEISTTKGILKGIVYDSKLRTIRILLYVSVFLTLLQLFTSVSYKCALMSIQSIIFPHWAASVFLINNKPLLHLQQWKAGLIVGAITGLIPAILICVINLIRFLSPDFRQAYLLSKGLDLPLLDPSVEIGGVLFAFITIGISFLAISSISGFMAALLPIHRLLEKTHLD